MISYIKRPSFLQKLKKGGLIITAGSIFCLLKMFMLALKADPKNALDFSVGKLQFIKENMQNYTRPATQNAFSAYEIMKDMYEIGELSTNVFDRYGGYLPENEMPNDV